MVIESGQLEFGTRYTSPIIVLPFDDVTSRNNISKDFSVNIDKSSLIIKSMLFLTRGPPCQHGLCVDVSSGSTPGNDIHESNYIHVNPETKVRGTNWWPPSEARRASEGGSGVLPRKFKKTCIANGAISGISELYL